MKIKTKISLGLIFLFTLFLFIGGLGIYNLHALSQSMKGILKANFETIEYAQNMLRSLNDIRKLNDEKQILTYAIEPLLIDFDKNLKQQENNITEIGEKDVTKNIRTHFKSLQQSIQNQDFTAINYTIFKINQLLYDLSDLNSRPIIRKNQEADKRVQDAIFMMSMVATLCFLFSFSFIFNFPSYIANPIRALTESIKKVADKNYNERLHFTTKDEFGELATVFNSMTKRLSDYENSNLAHLISEKQRIETIIDTIDDPLVGLDENSKILFVNTEGCAVLGLTKENLIGRYAPDVALKNDLLRALLTENANKNLKIFSNNKESHFEKNILNIKAQDKAIGKVILLRNVTQFQEREAENQNLLAAIFYELNSQIGKISKNINAFETDFSKNNPLEQQTKLKNIKDDIEKLTKNLGNLYRA
ncbi:MAG: HAMP domain-containing protein [Saprospiraceae bacterium]|nr:HAMP domain-containing protein [Saprospiraceae bacterium]